jgi:hypothetical protein
MKKLILFFIAKRPKSSLKFAAYRYNGYLCTVLVHIKRKDMAVLQVSTREFRERQASILDLADKGENVIIRRGNRAYTLTPISDEDLYFTPEILARIDESLQQAREGKVHEMLPGESLDAFLNRVSDV